MKMYNLKIKKVIKNKYLLVNLVMVFVMLSNYQLNAQDLAKKYSYDYSKIASHPRLLLKQGEEHIIKKSIEKSNELKKVDKYINEISDELLTKEPLVFKKKGKRLLAVSRDAITRLYYLSYSYRTTKDKKYLDRAEIELNTVCNFESWNPEHFLDIGEMCLGVSIAYDWLYDDLQESTKINVRKAIVEKAFTPSNDPKLAWFLKVHSNWNSVCNAGLVMGALAIMDDEKDKSIEIIERALKSNLLPLEVYSPDGNYPEGAGYWNYGTTFQVMLIAALESALGSDNGLSNAPGFMKTGDYMLFISGTSGDYFNYYDCGPAQEACSSLFWFANKTKNPSLVFQELNLINNGVYTKAVPSDIERILPNTMVFGKDLDLSKMNLPKKNLYVGNGLTPVTIVRTSWEGSGGKFMGIKGGSASDGHSHLDQGTFVYDIGSIRWAMDLGLQSYNTLESKGVDLWNMKQDSQRWDVFRYNNLNHNTLTINNQRHNIQGRANFIETYDKKDEKGAKIDLTSVLNFKNELKSATRKATIIDNSYLKIEDAIETNGEEVDLRWNMVSQSTAEIVDMETIKLTQNGKTLLVKFTSNVDFKLAIRPSENPSQYKCEFGNYNYGDYNHQNKGTIMIGFDSKIPANKVANYTVTLIEGKIDLKLTEDTIVLDAPNPNTASKGNNLYSDSSPIGIDDNGYIYAQETPDWTLYGKLKNKKLFNKSFKFKISPKIITPEGIKNAGIDRSNNGQLGVRSAEGGGIQRNQGFILGLDLSGIDPSVTFELTKIGFTYFDGSESCVIVNKKSTGKIMTYLGGDTDLITNVKLTSKYSTKLVDISQLNMVLRGGMNHEDFLTFFNTSQEGWFRVSGFEFVVK